MSEPTPAFPQHPSQMIGSERTWGDPGMTLRDWFAGQALCGMMANPDRVGNNIKFIGWAEQAFFYADAMLAARSAEFGNIGADGVQS